jgi:hypothetical protein
MDKRLVAVEGFERGELSFFLSTGEANFAIEIGHIRRKI